MKSTTTAAIIHVAMWLSVSGAIITGLVITGHASVLWFFLIPMLGMVGTNRSSGGSKDGKNE